MLILTLLIIAITIARKILRNKLAPTKEQGDTLQEKIQDNMEQARAGQATLGQVLKPTGKLFLQNMKGITIAYGSALVGVAIIRHFYGDYHIPIINIHWIFYYLALMITTTILINKAIQWKNTNHHK